MKRDWKEWFCDCGGHLIPDDAGWTCNKCGKKVPVDKNAATPDMVPPGGDGKSDREVPK